MAWIERKLGDVCRLINGRAYKKHEMLSEGPYPLLRVGNFFTNRSWYYSDMELHADKYCDDGDLLYAWSASFGPRIWDGGKVIYHYHIWKIEIDKELVDKNYLYYLLDWDKELIKSEQGAGTTMVHVTKGSMEKRILPFPCVEEQKSIVAVLDQVFANIEKALAIAETNLKNARELFDSYLQQVFSQRGEGWVEKKIGDVTDLSRGHNPPKSEFIYEPREGYVRFYQIRDGKSDKHAVYVPKSPKLQYANKNDILMVAYRHVGGAFRGVEGAFNVALCKITNKDRNTLHDDFLFHLIPSSFVKGELLKSSERSLIPSMSVKHLASLSIPIPPQEEQVEIVRKINSMEQKCKLLESIYQSKLHALTELKKSILQQAFTGELTKSKGIAA